MHFRRDCGRNPNGNNQDTRVTTSVRVNACFPSGYVIRAEKQLATWSQQYSVGQSLAGNNGTRWKWPRRDSSASTREHVRLVCSLNYFSPCSLFLFLPLRFIVHSKLLFKLPSKVCWRRAIRRRCDFAAVTLL